MGDIFSRYVDCMYQAFLSVITTDGNGAEISRDSAILGVIAQMQRVNSGDNTVMFVGNGGSAGIAGHMAIDFTKNGGVRALTFNDVSSVTCIGNDLGYDKIFSKQIEMQARPGDVLVAISSSGKSQNIVNAAEAAIDRKGFVVTCSGMYTNNPLRGLGDINFYVEANEYGFVETTHQAILHSILDIYMGWPDKSPRAGSY